MPKVVGLKRDEAINALKDAKLEVEVIEENSDDIEKDYVIKQTTEDEKEIAVDTEIPAGTTILIYVSMGIEQVEVPDLLGKTEAEAKTAIANAKLKWKSTDKISDSSKPNGVVVNQSISSESMVDKDTEITITVNEFHEVKTATINVNVKSLRNYVPEYETDEEGNQTLINSPEKVTLKITVGNDTVYDNSVSEDNEKISKSISGKGMTEIKVYINGVLQKQNLQFNFNTDTEWTAK